MIGCFFASVHGGLFYVGGPSSEGLVKVYGGVGVIGYSSFSLIGAQENRFL